jgi:hypothetical protein
MSVVMDSLARQRGSSRPLTASSAISWYGAGAFTLP